uniref:hypothetical protein n=1 Tax=Borrelia hispanica TaxID=40835 RepID=UPI001268BCC4
MIEKMRGIRRFMIISIVLVMMVCGQQGEVVESVENRFLKSLVVLSNEFLDVFTFFGGDFYIEDIFLNCYLSIH